MRRYRCRPCVRSTTASISNSKSGRRQSHDRNKCVGRGMGRVEIPRPCLSQGRKIPEIGHVSGRLHHIREGRSHARQGQAEIGEHPLGLGLEIPDFDHLPGAVEGHLPRDIGRTAIGADHNVRVPRRSRQPGGLDELPPRRLGLHGPPGRNQERGPEPCPRSAAPIEISIKSIRHSVPAWRTPKIDIRRRSGVLSALPVLCPERDQDLAGHLTRRARRPGAPHAEP